MDGCSFENAAFSSSSAPAVSAAISWDGLQLPQSGRVLCGPGGVAAMERLAKKSANPSRSQKDALKKARKYAAEQSIKTVLLKQTIAQQQQQMFIQQQVAARQQAMALMCRIYVGSICFALREDTVKQAFLPFGPMKSISMPYDNVLKKHKGFAFIEYDIPEAATMALDQMNGVMLGGYSIKVGRPSNMPQAQPLIVRLQEEAKLYNRIYVSAIHPDLSEVDLCSVFEAFGAIKSCDLVKDPSRPTKHRGYAFIEYESPQCVPDAIAAMNLFDLGGQYLRVCKAITPPMVFVPPAVPSTMPTAAAIAAAAVTAKITAIDAISQVTGSARATGSLPSTGTTLLPQVGLPGVVIPQTITVNPAFMPGLAPPPIPPSFLTTSSLVPGVMPPTVLAPSFLPPGMAMMAPPAVTSLGSAGTGSPLTWQPPQGITVTPMSMSAVKQEYDINDSMKNDINDSMKNDINDSMKNDISDVNGWDEEEMMYEMRNDPQKFDDQCRVMSLHNMVGPDEVDPELGSEVSEECSKFGVVERVDVRPGPSDVVIIVEFADVESMQAAVTSLNGRLFAGRKVIAQPYDQRRNDGHEQFA